MKRFVVLLFLLPSVGLSAGLLRLEDSAEAMGTTFTVAMYGEDRALMEDTAEAALKEVFRLDKLLSHYRADSDWSYINRHAAERPVKLTPELFQLLDACLRYSRQSEGTFDITVGPLMRVWGFYKGTGRLPKEEEIAQALSTVGYQNIVLDPKTRTVRFTVKGLEIDSGGIGKGYAVDRMVKVLREAGIKSGFISAGTSSVYGLGSPPHEKGWEVKIRDPRSPLKSVAEIRLKNEAMSTSGSYEQFFEAEGEIYSHIMDPRTGWPARGVLSVSVIADKTLDTEAWTKPLFILGKGWANRNKPKGTRVFLCEDRSELACAWLQ